MDVTRDRSAIATSEAFRRADPTSGHDRWSRADLLQLLSRGPRVLALFAHPDDESYLAGLLMDRARRAGGAITLACATRGELGGTPDDDPFAVGEQREQELRRALGVVGVDDVRWLGYRDGALGHADTGALVHAIELIMREVRPELVVTFGPDGITGHTDHKVVGAAATRAWLRCAPGELLYATLTDEFAARHEDLHRRIGLVLEGSRATVPRDEVVLYLTPTPTERRRKREMLDAHASQVAPLYRLIGEAVYHWMAEETFRRPTVAELETLAYAGRGGVRTDPTRQGWSPPDV